ncbi:TetR/AcrR family transcriptional regulator [Gulosibacter bifidus]|uniref:TetR/AcrR family transcriptional regulator n=1 Tax=Gulosibacter bifidus TaxID=272239 RepID=A0ABW5RMX0_9MICO|nr:TetR/AcrR family transcriptional regulator [Gulosibacter bifidus]
MQREDIVRVAQQHMCEVGPGALSMRAIARDLGVSVGALYRHVTDRDALLTELIVSAYAALDQATRLDAAATEPRAQWHAMWQAARKWALEHPHEFDLIYGTPVIGYEAPQQTVDVAMQVPVRLLRLAAQGSGAIEHPLADSVPSAVATDLAEIQAWYAAHDDGEVPAPGVIWLTIRAWTELIGTISFELHGHYVGSIRGGEAYLRTVADAYAERLGL